MSMHYDEIRVGMKVDFQDESGRVLRDCIITREPWMQYGKWVCKIDKRPRAVECARLTPAKKD
jgi:hypothetical protein